MPIYEYTCKECGNEFEELVPLNSETEPACPQCDSKNTTKKVSLFGGMGDTTGSSCGTGGFS